MTDEEMAEEYCNEKCKDCYMCSYSEHKNPYKVCQRRKDRKQAYLAGLKAGKDMNVSTKWHKVADGDLPKGDDSFGKTSIHRKIYLKDRYGNLYTGNYYPKDECHSQDCFAVEFLDWGLQGANFCDKAQISEWCEIPKYTEE